jgi:hypothetical protein
VGKPSKGTVAGVELVTIPLADYAKLLDCQRQLAALKRPKQGVKGWLSSVEKDAKVEAFIARRLTRKTVPAIMAECLERFGPDRTPSRSAIYRYRARDG